MGAMEIWKILLFSIINFAENVFYNHIYKSLCENCKMRARLAYNKGGHQGRRGVKIVEI